ncbi:ATP-binding cassette domain-containing protein [Halomonas sp. Bachu 37]|uniref:ATP-binding cassette domain-containing protein n=1 Tax=Halomonas kashgarensis TaxID=3084920 RepID=UPI0032170656
MPRQPMLLIEGLNLELHDSGGWRRRFHRCLHEVDFDLLRGEVHAVVGASGAGKSLLAAAIMGLLPGSARLSGTLDYDDDALTPKRQARLRGAQLAWVPQSLGSLDPLASCGRQVVWAARRAGLATHQAERAATSALQRYAVEACRHAYPHELSGGMARRILLAMATVGEPDLLIADEPSVGLDNEQRRKVLDYLRALADSGKGVMVISHDLRHALAIADRVSVFRQGRKLETTTAAAFSGDGQQLHSNYARALWLALPDNAFTAAPLTGRQHNIRLPHEEPVLA